MNMFFVSIVVGLMYLVFLVNIIYGIEFVVYNFFYIFLFFMIFGELIRVIKGCIIYIVMIFYVLMIFGFIFLFSEEIGDLFLIKVIVILIVIVVVGYIGLSLIIWGIVYLIIRWNFEEFEFNNYLDYVNDDEEINYIKVEKFFLNIKNVEKIGVVIVLMVGIVKNDIENIVVDELSIYEGIEKIEF